LVVTCALVGAGLLGLSLALAWGGQVEGETTRLSARTLLMLELLRAMLPYLLLVCLAAVFMGMLNARGHFFVPALGAALLNVVMIASVLWLAPQFGRHLPEEHRLPAQVFALAIGVVAAGFAQAGFQLPLLWREGFRWRWVTPWRDETVRRVVRQMLPATLGVAAFQINVVTVNLLAYWADDYVVASFQYAVRLMELPQGLFGISLATYLLPTLSGLAAEKNYDGFRSELRQGLGYLLFLNWIASALLVALAEPIIRLLFERGRFDAVSTHQATLALMCLAPGLVAFSTVNVLARAFYALGDTHTPMRISVFCLALNLLLAGALVWQFKQAGLGLANTATSALNVGLLTYALRRKLRTLNFGEVRAACWRLGALAALAGVLAWALWQWWERALGHATLPLKLGAVFVPAGVAGAFYLGVAWLLRVRAAREMGAMLWRKPGRSPAASNPNA
ncbi:MAG: murein biosynthesis integral membrane protein MurJ, partial [Verrucomicrobiales bacterium]|nr:murein biosynthesis integral membrane protein MurJ [Verrucomicrobiales bacterium]